MREIPSVVAITAALLLSNCAMAQTVYTWSGTGDWSTPARWTPVGVPGPLDTAIISTGTVTISSPVQVATLSVSGGTLQGAGDLTVTGSATWSGGTISGTGRFTLGPNSTASISANGAVTLERPLENRGAATLVGTSTWFVSPAGSFSNLAGGSFAVSGGAISRNGGSGQSFTNAGTMTKTGTGPLTMSIAFNNTGTLNVQAGRFNLGGGGVSTGTINVASPGQMLLDGSYTFSGGLLAGTGLVTFSSGSYSFAGNYALSSPLTITSANVSFESPITLPAISISGGTLGGSGDITLNGPLSWSGGTITGSGRFTLSQSATATISANGASSLGRAMESSGGVTLIGTSTFFLNPGASFSNLAGGSLAVSGGSISRNGGTGQSFSNAGTMTKSGNGQLTINIAFNNSGTLNAQAGTLTLSGGGLNTGTIAVSSPGQMVLSSSYTFSGGTLGGNGLVTFSSGSHSFANNYELTSPLTITSANVSFEAPITLPVINLTGGTLGGSGDITLTGSMTWAGGTLGGTGRLSLAAGSTSTIAANGATTLGRPLVNSGSLTLTGTSTFFVNPGITLTNNAGASFSLSAGTISRNGGTGQSVINAGTITKTGSTTHSMNIPLASTGTLNVQGGTFILSGGTPGFDAATSTLLSGKWVVQNAATLQLSSPANAVIRTIAPGASVSLNGPTSSFTNSGTSTSILGSLSSVAGTLELADRSLPVTPFGGTLSNSGRIAVGRAGVLAITGAYIQSAAGTSRFELDGLALPAFGTIAATTQATVLGAVEAAFINPPYTPVAGDAFAVITAPTVTGSISRVCVDQLSGGLGLAPDITPNALRLVATVGGAERATILIPPADASGCPGTVFFNVTAGGTDVSYQWQRETAAGVFEDLTDGGLPTGTVISGSTTAQLLLSGVSQTDAARYRVRVTNSCASVLSPPATLTVAAPCSLADIVGTDGGIIVCGDSNVDGSDFIAFVNSFAVGDATVDPLADVAGAGDDGLQPDGTIDGNDFIAFINAFALGC